jgi:hypothetical protein
MSLRGSPRDVFKPGIADFLPNARHHEARASFSPAFSAVGSGSDLSVDCAVNYVSAPREPSALPICAKTTPAITAQVWGPSLLSHCDARLQVRVFRSRPKYPGAGTYTCRYPRSR